MIVMSSSGSNTNSNTHSSANPTSALSLKKEILSIYFIRKLILSKRSGALIKNITILSFSAITLSLTAFFVVLFVMNGMNLNIKKRIVALEPHLVSVQPASQDQVVFELFNKKGEVLPFQSYDLIIRTVDGQFRGGVATGYHQAGLDNWFEHLKNLKKQNQSNANNTQVNEWENLTLGENEIALGVDLARSLGILEGDEVTLIPPETLLLSSLETPVFQKTTVKKIISTDLYDLDSQLVLFNFTNSLKAFSRTLSRERGFHVWLKNVSEAEELKEDLLNYIGKTKNDSVNTDEKKADISQSQNQTNRIKIETWQEKNSDLFFALMMEKTVIGVFLGLAGLIASSSILTVLALLMSQKKRDIALIKTLGLSHKKTLWLFTKMGLWISGGAIILGTFLGVGISLYLQYFPLNILPNVFYDSSIPALVNFGFVFIVIIFAVILAFLGSYFPALATLSIQPAILLRSKN